MEGSRRLRESGLDLDDDHLHSEDLLSLDAADLGGGFEAILGNPPYIRHHLLSETMAERGRESARKIGIALNGRSDAWAYFCAHLITFLSAQGKLALVLPGSVLHADYAEPLLDALAAKTGEVQLIRMSDRLFPGVQERTVLLLIDRAKSSGGKVIYRRIAGLDGLRRALGRELQRPRRNGEGLRDSRLPWRLNATEAKVWEEVCARDVAQLGDLARIRIGVVTGANSFFVRSESEAEALGRRVGSVPIVSRGAWLNQTSWDQARQAEVTELPSRLLVFPPSEEGLSGRAREELRRGERENLDQRSHCARRSPWYAIKDTASPDLFLPYMASQPRQMVINVAKATCTNAIHRVWLQPDAGLSVRALAAASWSTLYRLSAELVGRSYGGGVLKLEPTEAKALRIVMGGEPELLGEITRAQKDGGLEAGRQLADQRLLVDGLGLKNKEVKILATAAAGLEELRCR
jgi:hypothetical protein